ncbi:MAG: hypothetical protein ACK4GD_06935 [Sphingomonadaceae bacterium]
MASTAGRTQVIDYFALALIHGLLAVMVIRLSGRADLDREQPPAAEDSTDA